MIKLKVLQLTDAKGYEQNYYSAQLEALVGDKCLTGTDYFLTDSNVVVDIDKDIDVEAIDVKNAIELGAVIKDTFYIKDSSFSEHIYGFNTKGVYTEVGHIDREEYGVIFEEEVDAVKYKKNLNFVKDKVEVNGYEVIERENAIQIIKETNIEELAELLLRKQKHKKYGAICYLDLEDGIVKVKEDTNIFFETEVVICDLDESWVFKACIVNGEYVKEHEIDMLTSLLELSDYRETIEKFYTDRKQGMIKRFNEEKVCEIINLKLLEWKECSRIRGIQFDNIKYDMGKNPSEWKSMSEYSHRIPIDNFKEILEENKHISNGINCNASIPYNISRRMKINSNFIYVEIKIKNYKETFKITALEKRD